MKNPFWSGLFLSFCECCVFAVVMMLCGWLVGIGFVEFLFDGWKSQVGQVAFLIALVLVSASWGLVKKVLSPWNSNEVENHA